MAAGERRWRAAVKVGLDQLDVMLRHDLTESRVRFLAAVLSENVQRANFNPIEEADGLRAMLDLHDGNQAAAARAMGKSKAWFNQRIGLLRLSDEMVQLVLEGKLTAFRDMRRYAALPAGEQYAAWKRDQEQPKAPAPEPASVPSAAAPGAPSGPAPAPPAPSGAPTPEPAAAYTAVYADAPQDASVEEPALVPAQASAPLPPSPAPVPSPPVASDGPEAEERKPKRFPYHDGADAAWHLINRMPVDEFKKMLDACNEHWEKQTAGAG